jgi:ABC-type dipeptide/oligopeptide/nickel transport system permease component
MAKYIIRRLLLMIPTILGISIACFTITRILPGGPIEQAVERITSISQTKGVSTQQVNQNEIERLKKIYGFDKPFIVQYFIWMGNILRGQFGESFPHTPAGSAGDRQTHPDFHYLRLDRVYSFIHHLYPAWHKKGAQAQYTV